MIDRDTSDNVYIHIYIYDYMWLLVVNIEERLGTSARSRQQGNWKVWLHNACIVNLNFQLPYAPCFILLFLDERDE